MEREDRLEKKIDKVVDDIGEIKVTLSAQHVSLKEHMRRTTILEKELLPVVKHVTMVQGVIRALGLLAVIAGIAEGIAVLLTYLGGR